MHLVIALLSGMLVAATPLIFAGLGELVAERSGVLNLGVEGMMLVGAVAAFGIANAGHAALPAVAGAALAGAAAALLFAVLALSLGANQYAAGLALTILGSGVSGFIGRGFGGGSVAPIARIHIPGLAALDPMACLALGLAALVAGFLYRTRSGLVVRSVGESPESARAIGYPVTLIRYATTLFGGAMAGLGGAYLSLVYTPLWVDDMTAGRGWIALALVVFSSWRPGRLVAGAWLFGGVSVLQLFVQASGLPVPTELSSALPYVATIAVLVSISRHPRGRLSDAPLSLARPFRPKS
jgi:simple sugar transport system permease protein